MGPDRERHGLSKGRKRIRSGWGKIAQQSRVALSRDRREGRVGAGRKGNNGRPHAGSGSTRMINEAHVAVPSHSQQRMNTQREAG